jgi:hypothetical protein
LPDLSAYLAHEHQQAQESLAGQAALGLGVLWPALQFSNLAATAPAWLHAATLEVEKAFNKSAGLGVRFVQESLWAVDPTAGVIPAVPVMFPVERVQTGLRVTGPVAVKAATSALHLGDQRLTEGVERQVMAESRLGSTGAGVKFATEGGREGVRQQVQLADVVPQEEFARRRRSERVLGYARFTDSDPCYFCAILAARGAVYAENAFRDSSGGFIGTDGVLGSNVDSVHDHCRCSLRPVFRKSDFRDERAKFFEAQWQKFSKGFSGRDAVNAFRRKYTPPPPYGDAPVVDLGGVRANRQRLIDLGFAQDSPQVRFFDRIISDLSA